MKLAFLHVALLIAVAASPLHAEELNIGHLETSDDSASDGSRVGNWLFLHCDHEGMKLYCDATQTLIDHETNQADRAAEIAKMLRDAAGAAADMFKSGCGPIDQALAQMAASAAKGQTIDGRPLDKEVATDGLNTIKLSAAMCHNPSPENVRAFTAAMVDHRIRTCKVHQAYSKMEFNWDQSQSAWLLHEGPEALCRTITKGILKRDPASPDGFWLYTEIQTHDDIMLPGKNISCKKFDRTFNYTWRTAALPLNCLFLESFPD